MIRKIAAANLMVAFAAAFSFDGCSSITTTSTTTTTPRRAFQDTFSLSAKKPVTKKKSSQHTSNNKKGSSFGGGFGKVAVAAPLEVPPPPDDYSVFPALDIDVVKTLLSSPNEWLMPGPLPGEVYDRLDQIYGFPNFNFPALVDEEQESSNSTSSSSSSNLSLDELLMSRSNQGDDDVGSALSSTPPSSTMSHSEFDDLLASVTGDKSPSPLSRPTLTPTVNRSTTMEAIAHLPPFSSLRVLHVDPLVLAVDDFFTDEECARYIALSEHPAAPQQQQPQGMAVVEGGGAFQTRSKTVGKDYAAQSQRTSTTWFHHYKNVPELMSKASRLLGLDGIDRWEEAQTVRYRRNEKFTWHLDALSPAVVESSSSSSSREAGGQRTATLLVYLTDLEESDGGATIFRDLSYDNGDRLRV
jgi:hypothetical protein